MRRIEKTQWFEEVNSEVRRIIQSISRYQSRESSKTLRNLWTEIDSGTSDDSTKDGLYIGLCVLKCWISYSKMWRSMVIDRNYEESWNQLQNVIDYHEAFARHSLDEDRCHVNWISSVCCELERLYPHKIFMSIECVADEGECTLCGLSPLDQQCIHIPGNLYAGKIAGCRYRKITSFPAVAMTENPKDKRCIITGLNHGIVDTFVNHFRDKKFSPLHFSHCQWTSTREGNPHIDIVTDDRLEFIV